MVTSSFMLLPCAEWEVEPQVNTSYFPNFISVQRLTFEVYLF